MTITEGTNVLTYTYSADYQRIKGVLSGNAGAVLNKRYYFGDFERDITGAVTRDIHYIGGDGLNCIIEKIGNTTNFYYVYKDYLGSILTVTNSTGTIVDERNYDAWGKNRNVIDWTYNNIGTNSLAWMTRGYTGHEHLSQFGLINMNGRLYDPILGRMLSPDNYTQGGSQGYNRYTYALNNPLKYTDPSGQVIIAPIVYAGAALIGGVGNLWSNWDKVRGWKTGLAYFASGAIGGAVSLHNPAAGGNITAFGNIAIDVVSGNFPKFNNFWDVAKYGAGKVLDGLGAAGAGALAQAGYALAFNQLQKWGWLASYQVINGEFTTIASRTLERFAGYELSAEAANLIRGGSAEKLFTVNPKKFDYFFGKVTTGAEHNIQRSAQNLKDLTTLGIDSEASLMNVFDDAFSNGTIISTKITDFGTNIKKAINIGDLGSIDVSFFYEASDFTKLPSITTIIPKIFKIK
jgi:RHS repeat-associated protein